MAVDTLDIVRVWTDETYRRSRTSDELAQAPNPVGEVVVNAENFSLDNRDTLTIYTCSLTTYCLTLGPCC